jgi:hypothetical protein
MPPLLGRAVEAGHSKRKTPTLANVSTANSTLWISNLLMKVLSILYTTPLHANPQVGAISLLPVASVGIHDEGLGLKY